MMKHRGRKVGPLLFLALLLLQQWLMIERVLELTIAVPFRSDGGIDGGYD
jgi:hypothetical protein